MGLSHIKTNTITNTMTAIKSTTKYKTNYKSTFEPTIKDSVNTYSEVFSDGTMSKPFKIKKGTRCEFYSAHTMAVWAIDELIKKHGPDTAISFFKVKNLETGRTLHYVELL